MSMRGLLALTVALMLSGTPAGCAPAVAQGMPEPAGAITLEPLIGKIAVAYAINAAGQVAGWSPLCGWAGIPRSLVGEHIRN